MSIMRLRERTRSSRNICTMLRKWSKLLIDLKYSDSETVVELKVRSEQAKERMSWKWKKWMMVCKGYFCRLVIKLLPCGKQWSRSVTS